MTMKKLSYIYKLHLYRNLAEKTNLNAIIRYFLLSLMIFCITVFSFGCGSSFKPLLDEPYFTKEITGFSILGIPGSIQANNISLTVPYGTDRTYLTPTIEITGANVSPASGTAQNFTNPVPYTVTAGDGSTKSYTANVNVASNTAKDITGFSILGISGDIAANSISLTVPYGTSINGLTPTITITGASVSPASGTARNFTNPVTYTVTAADGSTKIYSVTVTAALNSAKDITGFTILGVSGTIAGNNISLTVPYGTNLSGLTPTITITGASVSPASSVTQNFTNPVTYTVTAADGSTKIYSVTVTAALNSAKDITGFTILGVSGTISGNNISLTVPYGTNLSSLTPTIAMTGASLSPASGVAQNFTNPVTYTVTAADSTTKTYTVTVTAALNSAKDITGFTILGVSGTIAGNNISLTVPYGNSLTSLTPTITITGASVSPASGVARDFTNAVTYTVTAADSTTKTYTINVNVAPNTAKDITGFTILGVSGTIAGNNISLTVPYGNSLTSLTPTITITGASVSPASGVARDFTNAVTYTVTADDSTTKTYTVTVTAALNSAKDITGFTILGVSGTVGADTVSLTVPYGTSLTSLTPTITITGASVSPASGTARNFTNPVTYTVTAADSTTKAYTVTVTAAEAGTIYWTEAGGAIKNIHNDKTGEVTLLTVSGTPLDIALDISGNRMYWTEYSSNSFRINRSVIGINQPIENFSNAYSSSTYFGPTAIAIDPGENKIYWNQNNSILWSNLSTFNSNSLNAGISPDYAHSICLDTVNNRYYMTLNSYWNFIGSSLIKGSGNNNVIRYGTQSGSDLGSPIQITGSPSPSMPLRGIAVDPSGGRVYFVSNNGSNISRTDNLILNANGHEVWISSSGIQKIALDLNNRKIYWTSDTNNSIYRADLDDDTPTAELVRGALGSKPTGIAIAQ